MATKKVKTDKNSAKIKAVDPFATVAEPASKRTAQKPTRPIKVIKAIKSARIAPPITAETAKMSNVAAEKRTIDAFAEVAKPAAEDEVKVELPPASVDRKVGVAKSTRDKNVKTKSIPEAATSGKSTQRLVKTTSGQKKVQTSPIAIAETQTLPPQGSVLSKPAVELSPVFKALADVKLPELPRENRARLQMQSPTRLYFYWSLRQNPWQQLRAVFGLELGSYTLVLKLRNLSSGTEEIFPIETQAEWWFNDAEPDTEYMAEIGFYATNRPYFRILYSNTVTTPRRSPSTHPAAEARWTVSAIKFAEVLDASGFTRDAVDVAIAGDDRLDAKQRTNLAFSDLMTGAEYSTRGLAQEDMRHAILALASGATIENLRHRVSPSVFSVLQANADRLSTTGARKALTEHFNLDETEWTEHEFGSAVFGASLVNFPKTLRSRKDATYSPRYNPVSSFSLGR
jgi:hypothetical protein